MTAKTNHKYYLANGTCIEYVLSPSSSTIVDSINRIISDHYVASAWHYWNDYICVTPEVFKLILIAFDQKGGVLIENDKVIGWQCISLQTPLGAMSVIPRTNLEWPIFIGSEQDLKDNSFNISMEQILCV